MRLQVVSMPATSNSRSVPVICSSSSFRPSMRASARKLIKSSRGIFRRGDFGGKERARLSDRALDDVQIGDAEFEKLVNPSAEQIAALWRNPKHGRNNASRDLLCVVDGAVGAAAA